MKLFRILVCIISCIFMFSGCATDHSAAPTDAELYKAGLDVISVMDEMVQSEEFTAIIDIQGFDSTLQAVNTGDYNTPIAVYRITPPASEDIIQFASKDDLSMWNQLSENLKEQIIHKNPPSSIFHVINNQFAGAFSTGFSTTYSVFDTFTWHVESDVFFLYVFEEGTPIAVCFSENTATGYFVFIGEMDNPSDIQSIFESFKCSVDKPDIE